LPYAGIPIYCRAMAVDTSSSSTRLTSTCRGDRRKDMAGEQEKYICILFRVEYVKTQISACKRAKYVQKK